MFARQGAVYEVEVDAIQKSESGMFRCRNIAAKMRGSQNWNFASEAST